MKIKTISFWISFLFFGPIIFASEIGGWGKFGEDGGFERVNTPGSELEESEPERDENLTNGVAPKDNCRSEAGLSFDDPTPTTPPVSAVEGVRKSSVLNIGSSDEEGGEEEGECVGSLSLTGLLCSFVGLVFGAK